MHNLHRTSITAYAGASDQYSSKKWYMHCVHECAAAMAVALALISSVLDMQGLSFTTARMCHK
jgi:hypothetical protein